MKTTNQITQFLIYLGIFLTVFGFGKLDTSNLGFDHNGRAYPMFMVGVCALIFAFFRVRKERRLNR